MAHFNLIELDDTSRQHYYVMWTKGQGGITMAECPECGAQIAEDTNYEEGEIIDCEDCGVELEVISDDPLDLALAPEEEEDWGE